MWQIEERTQLELFPLTRLRAYLEVSYQIPKHHIVSQRDNVNLSPLQITPGILTPFCRSIIFPTSPPTPKWRIQKYVLQLATLGEFFNDL